MSQDEWDALRPGDIVIERRSKTPRIVVAVRHGRIKQGRRRGRLRLDIELVKIRQSRYACPTTSLAPSDWRHRLDVAHGRHARVRREWFYCVCHGWSHVSSQRRAWVDPAYAAAHPAPYGRAPLAADVTPAPRADWGDGSIYQWSGARPAPRRA